MLLPPLAFTDAVDPAGGVNDGAPIHGPGTALLPAPTPPDRQRWRLSIAASVGLQLLLGLALGAALQMNAPPLTPWHDPAGAVPVELYLPAPLPLPARAVVQVLPPATHIRPRRPVVALRAQPLAPDSRPRSIVALPSPPAWRAPVPRPPLSPPPTPMPPAPAGPPAPSVRADSFADLRPVPPRPATAPPPAQGAFGETTLTATPGPNSAAPPVGGFDAGAALAAPAATPPHAVVAFETLPPPAAITATPDNVPAATRPPEIINWPQPAYTAEAALHRVEGVVVLRVNLRADGTVNVLEVVQGLPYGLNNAAAGAARALRFRPAQRGGMAVDCDVLVRFQFQLAY